MAFIATATVIDHLSSKGKVETGFLDLHRTRNDENTSPCAYLKVLDLVEFIQDIIRKDVHGFDFGGGFDECWWFLFSGDKGIRRMQL